METVNKADELYPDEPLKVLLTGATGFIGRRLLDSLLTHGARVRAVSRRPPHKTGLPQDLHLEVVQGDVLNPADLDRLLAGVSVAYYLIHSMEGGVEQVGDFVEKDRDAALAFGRAAARAGCSRIVYLSGLEPSEFVSAHLKSRNDVEGYLACGGVPVTTLRAGFIIGPGSAGFQMLQGIVGQLKTLMVNPDMYHKTQPAFIDDVVQALTLCLEQPAYTRGATFDLGAKEAVSYLDMIKAFCKHKGRPMRFIDVPWVPRELASAYICAVSDLPYALVMSLSEGLRTDLLATNRELYTLFPQLGCTSMDEAMRRSFEQLATPRAS